MRNLFRPLIVFTLLLFYSVSFSTISENNLNGGKVVGKGGAITADTMGISSLFFNPAALADMNSTMEIWASYGSPYEAVEGFSPHELAFSIGYRLMKKLPVAVGIKSSGDFSSLSFNTIYMGTASRITLGNSFLDFVSIGLSLKIINAHAANLPATHLVFANTDGFGFAGDLGVQVSMLKKKLVLGLHGRNLFSTKVSVIEGSEGDQLQRNLLAGLKYQLTDGLNITLDYRFLEPEHIISPVNLFGDSFTMANLFIGIEYSYLERIMVYTGFNEGALTLGAAVTDSKLLQVDFGLLIVPGLKMYSQIGLSFKPF